MGTDEFWKSHFGVPQSNVKPPGTPLTSNPQNTTKRAISQLKNQKKIKGLETIQNHIRRKKRQVKKIKKILTKTKKTLNKKKKTQSKKKSIATSRKKFKLKKRSTFKDIFNR